MQQVLCNALPLVGGLAVGVTGTVALARLFTAWRRQRQIPPHE